MLSSSRFLEHTTMYDLRTLRDNLDAILDQLGSRGADVPWDRIRTLIEQRRALTGQVEQLRHELRKGSDEVAKLKREKQPADTSMAAMKAVGEQIKKIEDELRGIEETLTDLNLRIPNLPHPSVPVGKDASGNTVTRLWGAPPKLTGEAKSHWDIGEALGIPVGTVKSRTHTALARLLQIWEEQAALKET